MLNLAECQIERDVVNLYDVSGIRRMQFWDGIPELGEPLPAYGSQGGSEGFFRIGADAKVGVGLGVENAAVLGEDVCRGDRQAPVVAAALAAPLAAIDEGDVDQDRAV